jgi:hypothetical protein
VCFSVQADIAAGAGILPLGILALREVRHAREIPFAALPLLFAAHQLVEALVWAGTTGDVSARMQSAAALVYVMFALPVLPLLMPVAVLLLEPRGARLRVAPFVGLGAVVSTYLAISVLDGPVGIEERPHALVYHVDLPNGVLWTVLYVVAVIGPALLSGYPSIVAFGALNLVGLTAVWLLYTEAFASLWCVYAALTSILIVVHMYLRRRLPDRHRMHGHPMGPAPAQAF